MDPVSKRVQTEDVTLHTKIAGPDDGNPIIFLHGFPEFWYAWHNQTKYFASRDYRVIVPDQRGYNRSDKPESVKSYRINHLVEDIACLINTLNLGSVSLVGHDWGGAVSWGMADNYPSLLSEVTILNCPHPTVFGNSLKSDPLQIIKSWYMFFFQLPYLPEQVMGMRNCFPLRYTLTSSSRSETFNSEDLAAYVEAWYQPGARRGMINWYRAAFRNYESVFSGKPSGSLEIPTKILWGKKDAFIDSSMARKSAEATDSELIFLDENTHWLQHENPETVNEEIKTFTQH